MIHLIEIRYSEWFIFWNGVLEFTNDEFKKLGSQIPPGASVEVKLPDGRNGFLYLTNFHLSSDFCEAAGVGKPN